MPIRINLLAEAQAAEDLRRRDPVKRAIWIGGFLVCVTLLWCGKLQFDIWREGMTRSRLEKDWAIKEPKFKTLTAMQNKAERLEGMLSNLDRYTTNRLLWANALNAIQKSMVEDIQLTRIRTEQSYEISAPQSQTNTTTTGAVVSRKPAVSTEKVRVLLEARDFNNQNQTWTKFKESLGKNEYFKRHLGVGESFVLDGTQSAPTRDPSDPLHEYVTFSLVSHMPEVKRYE
jgi:hypothetical protein